MKAELFDKSYQESLIDVLINNDWEFHSGGKPSAEQVKSRIESGYYLGEGVKTFILFSETKVVGILRIFDLGSDEEDSETPLFDLRIIQGERNKGLGKKVTIWLINYVFTTYPNKTRIEATTRSDNIAMRKVLEKCGFVKEAHYRQSWKAQNGDLLDTISYGILRKDWESNTITPVNWDE